MTAPIESSTLCALRQRRLAELRRLLRKAQGRSARRLTALCPIFFKDAPDAFILGYTAEDLRGILTCAYRILTRSAGRQAAVAVFNPDARIHGFASDRTVIQISAPDGPFYVSSVRARLRALDQTVLHLIHPILPVAWDRRGGLVDVGNPRHPDRQSLIHIEIERIEDARRLARIEEELRSVFADLRLVIDDFQSMRLKLAEAKNELSSPLLEKTPAVSGGDPEVRRLVRFMQWLDDENFVFLGYREYDVVTHGLRKLYAMRRGSGLGILRREELSRFRQPIPLSRLPAPHRKSLLGPERFVITQTTSPSPLYRRERMVCVSLKRTDGRGRVSGERRFIGLFTNRVEGLPATDIPILSEKYEELVKVEGLSAHSHDYREMYGLFSSYPKDFLFGADVEDIRRDIRAAMAAQSARDFKATFRPSRIKDEIAVMVVMAKDKFSRDVRLRIEDCLRRRLQATEIDTTLSMGAETGEFARLYFSCLTDRKTPASGAFADLEREIAELAKTWPDRLQEELVRTSGPREGRGLFSLYGTAFSVEFHNHTPPGGAAHDIRRLEMLYATRSRPAARRIDIDIFNSKADTDCSRIKLYHLETKLVLSDVMPVLTNHGLRVVDEVSNSVRPRPADGGAARPLAFIHTFRIQHGGSRIDIERRGRDLSESILSAIEGGIEFDPLCSLILSAGLSPRAVALLRLYRNYLHQIVPVHTLRSIDEALVRNSAAARLLVERFQSRFDPSRGSAATVSRRKAVDRARAVFEEALERVDDILEDRILRLLANAVDSTVRTNYFQTPLRRTMGIKIHSAELLSAPKPVPLFEIFVCDPDFEGIHLRGGRIARGGIRHSDRRDDYRTEVLGLMKTQMVKNAIIVPSGAKGGFVVKSVVTRERMREAAVSAYRRFIRTLLDLTDNYVGSRVAHPTACVIYDKPDPYLVVAADKGTADFSDIANAIAEEAGFWLGDAFASGGRNGYDHKKLGITARGALECVRHHLEMLTGNGKKDISLTCVGIGDMAGDVFGNGMLYLDGFAVGSRRVTPLLKAAFNHQHIFLDPNPDPAKAAAERRRLFAMPRSAWNDYSRSAISPGGGVYLRSSKKIVLSRAAASMLGLGSTVTNGEEVIRQILKMDVDLLYNGGIGTYVKAASERQADVGDAANDRVRINASEIRCRIVSEGGNNGFTQPARIEFARAGGRIDTDAVDNSAGVDLSDHEVNLKILTKSLRLPASPSRSILKKITEDVCRIVLKDNILQSRILTCEEWRSVREIDFYPRLLEHLAAHAGLSREVEFLPSDKELSERAKQGAGMYRPELAVILAYVKLALETELLEGASSSRLSADPILGNFLIAYFPEEIRRLHGRSLTKHPLAEQIVAACAANAFVNQAGLTAAVRWMDEFGVSARAVIKAYFVAESLIPVNGLREDVFRAVALPGTGLESAGRSRAPMPAFVAALDAVERSRSDVSRWLLGEYRDSDPAAALAQFRDFRKRLPRLKDVLSASDLGVLHEHARQAREWGFAPSVAERLACLQLSPRLLELEVACARLRRLR